MEPAFLPPTFLPSTTTHRRTRCTRRATTLCATTAPGSGELVGPRRRPLDSSSHNHKHHTTSDTAERDVVESLRPSRGEILDAHRLKLRQAAAAQKRARAERRRRRSNLDAPVAATIATKSIETSTAASNGVAKTAMTPTAATATLVKEPQVDAPLASNVPGTSNPLAFQKGEENGLTSDDVTAAWVKRGNSNRIVRTVEIWWFFFRMVTGELKIRKMEDAQAASAARREHARALKDGLLILGPTFIKLGQLMSTRVDIVAKEYIDELSSLQDRVPGFSGQTAIDVIEAEFGKPINEIYDSFDPVPLAAASLGQVHRAVYRGRQVAIKVQRAGLKELFDLDLKNFRALAGLLDKFDPKNDGASRNWIQIFEESAKLLYEEIDYVHEGKSADLFRTNFKNIPWVKVPKVYWELTTPRILTMEYVPGIKINDYEAIERAGIDRKLLAERSAESYLTQLLRHGFFHTDPHCGNLAVDSVEGGRIIYYDFGMMSGFQPNIKRGLVDVIFGIYEGNERDICDAMVQMGVLKKGADRLTVEKVGRYFLGLFRTNMEAGNLKKSKEEKRAEMMKRLNNIGEDLLAVSEDECFSFPPVFTFVFRAFTTLEGIGKGLNPSYDLTLIAGPYLKELIDLKDGSATVTAIKAFRKKVGWRREDIGALITQPRKTAYIENTLRRMESGDLRLRVRVLESERSFKRVTIMQQNMGMALLASTVANMAVVLSTAGQRFALQAKFLWLVAAIATVRLIIGILKYRAVEKRLSKYTRASL